MSASETKWVRLGEYIEQSDKRNSDGALTETDVQGISTDKCFIPTKANLDGVSVLSYKIGKHSASCVFFSPLFLPTFVASL